MSSSLASRWRVVVLASMGALAAIILVWFVTRPATPGRIIIVVLAAIPLLAPLFGIWSRNERTYRWATMCVLPYLVFGITETIANPATRVWTATVLTAALVWFVALIAYLRVSVRR